MSNGRHFSPPTPAYRPRDPFSNATPRLAEYVPSSQTTRPPPSRPRPVRMDARSSQSAPVPAALKPDLVTPLPPRVEGIPAPSAKPSPAPLPEGLRAEHARLHDLRESQRDREAQKEKAREEAPPPVCEEPETKKAKEVPTPKGEVRPEPRVEKARPEVDQERPTRKTARAEKKAKEEPQPKRPHKGRKGEEEQAVGPDEEVRICEWEKCGKKFTVKNSGRTVVRRFCSGTCRGRASEARTGKR